jgi:hypothetical protein
MICKTCEHGMLEFCSRCDRDTCVYCDRQATGFFLDDQDFTVICGQCMADLFPGGDIFDQAAHR